MLINTLVGPVEESSLVKMDIKEPIPCGECVSTEYFLDGKLVRRDITINVKEGFALGSAGGLLQ